ncbi:hypothetical protein GCM10023237_03720 [Streptomyces coeruleoprunus]
MRLSAAAPPRHRRRTRTLTLATAVAVAAGGGAVAGGVAGRRPGGHDGGRLRHGALQSAVASATAGTTIQVRGGTYYPTSTLKSTANGTAANRITLTAYGSEQVRIDGSRLPRAPG